jgi:soluble lytic murein transglycosylase-like protein
VSAPAQLVSLARKTAAAHALDPALVCAVCEQESAWNPWAIRYEPLFFAKYVAPLYTNNKISATEAYARGFSWGLMQVMGQVAREHGYTEPFLSTLCDPSDSLEIACKVLRKKFDAADVAQTIPYARNGSPQLDVTARALLLWNGGSNPAYPAQVLARRIHYL